MATSKINMPVGLREAHWSISKDSGFSAEPCTIDIFKYNGFAIIYFNIWTDISAGTEVTVCNVSQYLSPIEKMNYVIPGQVGGTLLIQIYTDGRVTALKSVQGNTFYRGTIIVPIL